MEKQILLITDFSKASWNALIFAMDVFKSTKARFIILHCYKKELLKHDTLVEMTKSEAGLQRIMQGISFRKENFPHQFETISSPKKIIDAVEDVTNSSELDLVLLGSKGEFAGINSAYHNWVSEISQNLDIHPILVVPESCKFDQNDFSEIVFPTPFNNHYQSQELKPLLNLAKLTKAVIRIVDIQEANGTLNEEQEENKQNLMELLKPVKFTFHTLTQTTVSTGIRLFTQSRNSNMLSLYRRKQGFFSRLFNQSMEKDIDFDPSIPVLIINEMDKKE